MVATPLTDQHREDLEADLAKCRALLDELRDPPRHPVGDDWLERRALHIAINERWERHYLRLLEGDAT